MDLAAMLAYVRSFLDDGSVALVDGDNDQLWSDDLIVRFLNEGVRLLARAAWNIIDEGNATAGAITLATGVATYALHKSVLRVIMATPTDQSWPLWHTSDVALRSPRPYDDEPFDINNLSIANPGRPVAFSTDGGTRMLRVFRTPSVTENGLVINLKVARLPVATLTLDDTSVGPETPDDYSLSICDYAAGRCLLQPNVDGQQKTTGRELITAFNDLMKDARRDRQRAENGPAVWGFDSSTALLGQGSR